MDYYTPPENEVRIRWYVEGSYRELKYFLESQAEVESVSVSTFTTDALPDLNAVVQTIGRNSLVVRLKPEVLDLAKIAAITAVQAMVKNWIEKRNTEKKQDINDGKDEPLLFDQYGRTIKISKKKK